MKALTTLALMLILTPGIGMSQQRSADLMPGERGEVPQISLAEALDRAAALDPDYVTALHQVGDASWRKRSAYSSFILPNVNFQSSGTRFSEDIFNVGTARQTDIIVDANLSASYDLFRGGAKYQELRQARAEFESASANELQARFQTALNTESDYYNVLAEQELTRVASERVRRAEEQLAVARARVVSGAAVQTDSLSLFLELTRAQVDQLIQRRALQIARYQLGRRVGEDGPVDAMLLDTLPAPDLPITLEEAVAEARQGSPGVIQAEADARAAEAAYKATWSEYLPSLTVYGQYTGFDEEFFPTATTRSLYGIQLEIPIWNNAQRELRVSQAGTGRASARARRDDIQRGIARDVVEAYEGYETARASADLAGTGVIVARENLRVQEERYRAGATTIIDLVTAQVDLADAEAGLVQARQANRIALARLEAILGRRLLQQPGQIR
jgi:outer membrane protein TolC